MNFGESNIIKKEKDLLSHQKKVKNRIRLDLFCFNLLIILGILLLAGFCIAGAVQGIFDSTPVISEQELLSDGYASVFYDISGNEIQTVNGEQAEQEYVSGNQISDALKNAFLASEDSRFYKHHGVDIRGVLTSLYAGLKREKNQEEVNRTITQKLLKNQVFGNDDATSLFSGLTEKLQEQYLAVKLEDTMGKEKILEYYLNTICLGENILGVQSASKYYFDKDAADITIAEAAVLAAAGQDCERFHPLEEQEANATQREMVLESMLNMGCISEDDYEDALGEDVYMELQNGEERKKGVSEAQTYYIDAVSSKVIEDLKTKLGYSQTRAYNAVHHSGLKIYTCQDKEIQQICDEVIQGKESDKQSQVSVVVMDQSTGRVKALNGGYERNEIKIDENGAVDYLRDPGTVFSILSTWLPALDTAGMTMGTVEDDSSNGYLDDKKRQGLKNSSEYQGLVTIRESILGSLRIPAVKILEKVTPQTGYDYLLNLGFSTLVDRSGNAEGNTDTDISLSLAAGKLVEGVCNLELTAAYASIANGGRYMEPIFYIKVVDRDGNVLLENEPDEKRIIKASTTWLLTDAMTEFILEEEGKDTIFDGKEIQAAGLFGASDSKKDFWFEGYTPYYTTGVWCGSEDGKQDHTRVYKEIWKEIMKEVHRVKQIEKAEFQKPSDIVERIICTKCGNLAVEGLCNETQEGNCIRKEFFARGTEPVENCNCHIRYTVCKESGELASENCPKAEKRSKVFLIKEETNDTKDTPYVLPKDLPEIYCSIHK